MGLSEWAERRRAARDSEPLAGEEPWLELDGKRLTLAESHDELQRFIAEFRARLAAIGGDRSLLASLEEFEARAVVHGMLLAQGRTSRVLDS